MTSDQPSASEREAIENRNLEAYKIILKVIPTFKSTLLSIGGDISSVFTLVDAVSLPLFPSVFPLRHWHIYLDK